MGFWENKKRYTCNGFVLGAKRKERGGNRWDATVPSEGRRD